MKLSLVLGSALVAAACASTQDGRRIPVRFEIVEAFDAPGDEIVLEEVRCDRARIEPGATLAVRGHCSLRSSPSAQLYFGLTNGAGTLPPLQELAPGDHAFDLTLHVTEAGMPHVSMYAGPAVNGGNCIGKRRFEIHGE